MNDKAKEILENRRLSLRKDCNNPRNHHMIKASAQAQIIEINEALAELEESPHSEAELLKEVLMSDEEIELKANERYPIMMRSQHRSTEVKDINGNDRHYYELGLKAYRELIQSNIDHKKSKTA